MRPGVAVVLRDVPGDRYAGRGDGVRQFAGGGPQLSAADLFQPAAPPRLGLPGVVAVLLNHRMLERSKRPERRRLTPAKLLPGAMHGHWLELLGFSRFARPA